MTNTGTFKDIRVCLAGESRRRHHRGATFRQRLVRQVSAPARGCDSFSEIHRSKKTERRNRNLTIWWFLRLLFVSGRQRYVEWKSIYSRDYCRRNGLIQDNPWFYRFKSWTQSNIHNCISKELLGIQKRKSDRQQSWMATRKLPCRCDVGHPILNILIHNRLQ